MRITVIGIQDKTPEFSINELQIIQLNVNFAGGKRHYDLVTKFLPENHQWTNITVPLSNLFDKIKSSESDWVVFASGDPLFFGIGITLKREFPDITIDISPDFNSLQLLAHRFRLPYGEFQTITLTGRNFDNFDKALILGTEKMGILTDRNNTPKTIAQRMLNYGYSNYKMYYGECLGGDNERIVELNLNEVLELNFNHPNCFYLEKIDHKIPMKGISETDFLPLDGRPNMITKMPIRLTTLALMNLNSKQTFWDVGACTGSVSIDAKLHYPHLKITAFEVREESEKLICENTKRFQTPGIQFFIDDYLQVDKSNLSAPDAVFLGGYGGEMHTILDDIQTYLCKNGVIAFNSVSEKSANEFKDWCSKNLFVITNQMLVSVDEFNPITIFTAQRSKCIN
jgi:precorrin-6Y C5,15-methyltransferase (decarboxylating)